MAAGVVKWFNSSEGFGFGEMPNNPEADQANK